LGEQRIENESALQTWLSEQARTHDLTTLLAHADDGVIWGYFVNEQWQLSHPPFPELSPKLRLETLQECRLFGEQAEVYLWRDDLNSWRARLIKDDAGEAMETFDETHLLWGTEAIEEKDGFTRLADGTMENQHTPPVSRDQLNFNPDQNYRPLRLRLRHYLDTDRNAAGLPEAFKVGLTYIALNRLVALEPAEEVKP
jgi:CRISPR-associated protein (TIGR03984 family)